MSETIFVLLATFDDPDPTGLGRSGHTHDVNDLPADAELVTAFRNAGAHVHLYQCHLDGGSSNELVLFERAPEPQPQPQLHGIVRERRCLRRKSRKS